MKGDCRREQEASFYKEAVSRAEDAAGADLQASEHRPWQWAHMTAPPAPLPRPIADLYAAGTETTPPPNSCSKLMLEVERVVLLDLLALAPSN